MLLFEKIFKEQVPFWIPVVCQVISVHNALGKKWTVLILQELFHNGSLGFNKLKSKVDGATNKMLSQRLQELEQDRIIERKIVENSPQNHIYALTRKGKDLLLILNKTKEWGIKYNQNPENCVENNCNTCVHLDLKPTWDK